MSMFLYLITDAHRAPDLFRVFNVVPKKGFQCCSKELTSWSNGAMKVAFCQGLSPLQFQGLPQSQNPLSGRRTSSASSSSNENLWKQVTDMLEWFFKTDTMLRILKQTISWCYNWFIVLSLNPKIFLKRYLVQSS